MAEDTEAIEDPERAVDRLEAALERIATLARRRREEASTVAPSAPDPVLSQVVADLDALIDRLRSALAARPE